MNEITISMLEGYINISINGEIIALQNINIENITIKREDNDKPVILVEAKPQEG